MIAIQSSWKASVSQWRSLRGREPSLRACVLDCGGKQRGAPKQSEGGSATPLLVQVHAPCRPPANLPIMKMVPWLHPLQPVLCSFLPSVVSLRRTGGCWDLDVAKASQPSGLCVSAPPRQICLIPHANCESSKMMPFSQKSPFVSHCGSMALKMNCGKLKAKKSPFFIRPEHGKSLENQAENGQKVSPKCRNFRGYPEGFFVHSGAASPSAKATEDGLRKTGGGWNLSFAYKTLTFRLLLLVLSEPIVTYSHLFRRFGLKKLPLFSGHFHRKSLGNQAKTLEKTLQNNEKNVCFWYLLSTLNSIDSQPSFNT
jgi:hypothetical protein